MTIDCEIFPRQSLDCRQLKRLGAAFQAFVDANATCIAWIDYLGIEDLRKGEQPKPLLLRITEHSRRATIQGMSRAETILLDAAALAVPEATPQNVSQWRQALGDHIADRSLPFVLRPDTDVTRVVQSLRQHIPDELVDDVLIGQQHWTQF
jgi:hypothetical protein